MIRDLDRPLLIVVFALALFGTLILYSAEQTDVAMRATGIWTRQLMWLGVGSIAAAFSYRMSFRILDWAAPWVYGLGLGLLVLTIVGLGSGGEGSAASTSSWLTIAGRRVGQPVELAKLATILMLARWLSARRDPPTTLRGLVAPITIALVPALLVLKQPDLGSAMVFAGILFIMLFWSGVAPSLLFLLVSPVVSLFLAWNTTLWSIWMVVVFLALLWIRPFIVESIFIFLANSAMGALAIVVWARLSPFQRNRILSFLNPEEYRRGPGYQAMQSKVAIGSGGWFGSGFTDGPLKRTGGIPEHWTDFVFAIVGEEFGFLGVTIALGLFLAFFFILVRIARRTADPYASLVVFGLIGLVLTHLFENVGMTISLMPITGIPLPFFSYGGSFLLALFLGLGMAFRAAAEARASGYVDS
ncbi:MAG: rod shape-determining protein RodA [Gemmatimonadetes bacterium]|nr:rod shape-determining protein RodA [Gemmatimonadota bacterium]